MKELFTLNENDHPEMEIDDVKYGIVDDPTIITHTIDEFSKKLAVNKWREYMNVGAKDMAAYLNLFAPVFTKSMLSSYARCMKTNKVIGFDLGIDFYEDKKELEALLPPIFKKEGEFFKESGRRIKSYYHGRGVKGKGEVAHLCKGAVFDGFEGRKVFQRLIALQYLNCYLKGYTYSVGEPTSPGSQSAVFNHHSTSYMNVIDEAYFEDYEENGKKFIAPKTDRFQVPRIVTTNHFLREFVIANKNHYDAKVLRRIIKIAFKN